MDGGQALFPQQRQETDLAEFICSEQNAEIKIGNEHYFLSADGLLMPSTKDQPPPDLKYFKRSQR